MEEVCNAKEGICKYLFLILLMASEFLMSACSVNPATGEKQFTALMPPGQEAAVGAQEHEKVRQTYGDFVTGPIADYVDRIGQKVAANTERSDVRYQFFVLDSPIVNAFALPGGYIYISRGILSLANSEAELAGVIAHEIAHVTARHAAERMSQGVLVGLGAAILSVATGSDTVGQIANVGSDLYIRSYSRTQETQADELGVRYLSRAGYDPRAMASFLASLDAQTKLDLALAGKSANDGFNYFSTHPLTSDRIAHASQVAMAHPAGGIDNRDVYLAMINGLTYGDSEHQGFVRAGMFYHPVMGFAFSIPDGFAVTNNPTEVIATHKNGSIIILDSGRDDQGRDPLTYLAQDWMKGNPSAKAEAITINGLRAATAAFAGVANNKPVTIRVVAIEWKPGQFFRFQMAIPETADVGALKRTTYSFHAMTDSERQSIRPLRLKTVTAGAQDTVQTLSSRMAYDRAKEERFRVLNGMSKGDTITAGQVYKIVTQ
jgi:predicted Zn-dependent protease